MLLSYLKESFQQERRAFAYGSAASGVMACTSPLTLNAWVFPPEILGDKAQQLGRGHAHVLLYLSSTSTNNNEPQTLMSLIHFLWRLEVLFTYTTEVFREPIPMFSSSWLKSNSSCFLLHQQTPLPKLSVKGWWTIDGSNSFHGNSIRVISLETCIKTFHLQTSSVHLGRPLFPWMCQHGGASSPGPWPLQFPLAPDAHGTLGIELDSGRGGGWGDLECFSQPNPWPECIVYGPAPDTQQT